MRSPVVCCLTPLIAVMCAPRDAVAGPPGAVGDLYVSGHYSSRVVQYDGITGSRVGEFVTGDADFDPRGIVFGPSGNLFAACPRMSAVLEFNGQSGALVRTFAAGAEIYEANQLAFGPNGDLFVSNVPSGAPGPDHHIARYDRVTGQLLGILAPDGLWNPQDVLFVPNGNLLVANSLANNVLELDPNTGNLVREFVPAGLGGLDNPTGLTWGSDGDLYVASLQTDSILRYDGLTGSFIGTFASGQGLAHPRKLEFGPNANLFVANDLTDSVTEFDGVSGAYIGVFASGGGLDQAEGMTFKTVPEPSSALLCIAAGLLFPYRRSP